MGFQINLITLAIIGLYMFSSNVSGKVCREVCEEDNSTSVNQKSIGLLKDIKALDVQYANVLKPLVELDESDINSNIMETFITYGGIVDNQLKQANNRAQVKVVPSFLRLGDHHLVDFDNTTIFFHELQTTEDTIFEVTSLESNFQQFFQKISLNLNNLELNGIGEYAEKKDTPNFIHYIYKDVSFTTRIKLIKAKYEADLNLRVSGNTFRVEDIKSVLQADKVVIQYTFNGTDRNIDLEEKYAGCFVNALNDLCGRWLAQYMNTILDKHISLSKIMGSQLDELRKYFYERTEILNNFLEPNINNMTGSFKPFTLSTPHRITVKITNGTYHDISTLYREKPTTGSFLPGEDDTMYKEAAVSGRFRFSRLKLFLNYIATVPQMSVPLRGVVIIDEDQAYMNVDLKVLPEKLEWSFKDSHPADSYSLTVQGPLSRYFSTVKHILTHQILTLAKRNLREVFKGLAMYN